MLIQESWGGGIFFLITLLLVTYQFHAPLEERMKMHESGRGRLPAPPMTAGHNIRTGNQTCNMGGIPSGKLEVLQKKKKKGKLKTKTTLSSNDSLLEKKLKQKRFYFRHYTTTLYVLRCLSSLDWLQTDVS